MSQGKLTLRSSTQIFQLRSSLQIFPIFGIFKLPENLILGVWWLKHSFLRYSALFPLISTLAYLVNATFSLKEAQKTLHTLSDLLLLQSTRTTFDMTPRQFRSRGIFLYLSLIEEWRGTKSRTRETPEGELSAVHDVTPSLFSRRFWDEPVEDFAS